MYLNYSTGSGAQNAGTSTGELDIKITIIGSGLMIPVCQVCQPAITLFIQQDTNSLFRHQVKTTTKTQSNPK